MPIQKRIQYRAVCDICGKAEPWRELEKKFVFPVAKVPGGKSPILCRECASAYRKAGVTVEVLQMCDPPKP